MCGAVWRSFADQAQQQAVCLPSNIYKSGFSPISNHSGLILQNLGVLFRFWFKSQRYEIMLGKAAKTWHSRALILHRELNQDNLLWVVKLKNNNNNYKQQLFKVGQMLKSKRLIFDPHLNRFATLLISLDIHQQCWDGGYERTLKTPTSSVLFTNVMQLFIFILQLNQPCILGWYLQYVSDLTTKLYYSLHLDADKLKLAINL